MPDTAAQAFVQSTEPMFPWDGKLNLAFQGGHRKPFFIFLTGRFFVTKLVEISTRMRKAVVTARGVLRH